MPANSAAKATLSRLQRCAHPVRLAAVAVAAARRPVAFPLAFPVAAVRDREPLWRRRLRHSSGVSLQNLHWSLQLRRGEGSQ